MNTPQPENTIKHDDSCYFCGGKITGRFVTYTREFQGRVVIIRNVPALVCSQCGERYFAPDTVEWLHDAVRHGKAKRTETVPVYEFPAPGR